MIEETATRFWVNNPTADDIEKAIGGLSLEEFEDFGPLLLFRSMFLEGYYHLLVEIAKRRALLAAK